jgi:hypothetical protein
MRNKNLNPDMYAKLRRNVPAQHRNCTDEELCGVWSNYWENKLN